MINRGFLVIEACVWTKWRSILYIKTDYFCLNQGKIRVAMLKNAIFHQIVQMRIYKFVIFIQFFYWLFSQTGVKYLTAWKQILWKKTFQNGNVIITFDCSYHRTFALQTDKKARSARSYRISYSGNHRGSLLSRFA